MQRQFPPGPFFKSNARMGSTFSAVQHKTTIKYHAVSVTNNWTSFSQSSGPTLVATNPERNYHHDYQPPEPHVIDEHPVDANRQRTPQYTELVRLEPGEVIENNPPYNESTSLCHQNDTYAGSEYEFSEDSGAGGEVDVEEVYEEDDSMAELSEEAEVVEVVDIAPRFNLRGGYPRRGSVQYRELMRQASFIKKELDRNPNLAMSNGSADLLAFLRLQHAKELEDDSLVIDEQLGNDDMKVMHTHQLAPSMSMPNMFVQQMNNEVVRKRKNANPVVNVATGPCCVCEGDVAAFHFGAIACAACSAFFRRTISERRTYTCSKVGADHMNCPIDKRHRCYCRACRLKKCLAQGMDPSAVQPHRDSIGTKATPLKRSSQGPSPSPTPPQAKMKMSDPSPSYQMLQPALPIPPRSFEDSLADHLQRHRTDSSTVPSMASPTMLNSPTAQLLTSTRSFAEQLLAFSRTPVISMANKDGEIVDPFNQRHLEDGLIVPKDEPLENGLDHQPPSLTIESQPVSTSSFGTMMDDSINKSDGSSDFMIMGLDAAEQCKNTIDSMVENYRKLLERRRLIFCPSSIRDILSGTLPIARPAKFLHRVRRDNIRVELGLFVEFLNSIMPFPHLSVDDKVALLKHLSVSYTILEKYYSTMKQGGLQVNRIIHADGTYTDLDNPDSIEFDTEMEGQKMDRTTFNKLFVKPLRESMHEICAPMYHSRMTDVEFCALVAILLFDPAAPGLAEQTRCLVRDTRDRIYREWFAYYEARGIHDGCEKVGNAMLLLPALQSAVEKTAESFHLVRVFELFEYDTILDEVFSNGNK